MAVATADASPARRGTVRRAEAHALDRHPACSSRGVRCVLRRFPSGTPPARPCGFRPSEGPVARARSDRGTSARGHAVRSALIGLRLWRGPAVFRPDEQTELLYALLLKDAGCLSQRASRRRFVRRRRSGGQARGVAARLAAHAGTACVCASRTSGAAVRRGSGCAASDGSRCRGGAAAASASSRYVANAARRSLRMIGLSGRSRASRFWRWTSTGTAAAILYALRRDQIRSLRPHHRPGAGDGDLLGRRADRRGPLPSRAIGKAVGSIPISWTRSPMSIATAPSGPGSPTRASVRTCWGSVPGDLEVVADETQLNRVADAFALIIDAKSPFTFDHSRRVASYATWPSTTGRAPMASIPFACIAPACCTTSAS